MALFETGEICLQTGTYYCVDHPEQVVKLEEGEKFPQCSLESKLHATYWMYQFRSHKSIKYEPREKSNWFFQL